MLQTRQKYAVGSAKSVFVELVDFWSPAGHGHQSLAGSQEDFSPGHVTIRRRRYTTNWCTMA